LRRGEKVNWLEQVAQRSVWFDVVWADVFLKGRYCGKPEIGRSMGHMD
jgi:hypothetical protein